MLRGCAPEPNRRGRIFRALLAGILPTALGASAARAQTPPPTFQKATCPFHPGVGQKSGKGVRCGYLLVPENRNQPGSPTIRLAVAIFKAPDPNPAPDPIVFLQGGPGGSILGALGPGLTPELIRANFGNRAVILIDQRGTGYSRPALNCPELTRERQRHLADRASLPRQEALQARAIVRCHDRLVANGIDLAGFSTLEDAADIADLRTALGYSQLDLYGVSYGTRLALSVMANYPQGIHSVVLDSVVPPSFNIFADPSRSMARIFDLLFQSCRQAQRCGRQYPHLEQDFSRTVSRLDAHPATLRLGSTGPARHASLTGFTFAQLIFQAFYVTPIITFMPQAIDDTAHGHYGLITRLANLFAGDAVNAGVYFSVSCGDDAPYTSDADIASAVQGLPAALRQDELTDSLATFHICQQWEVPATAAAQRQPVKSDIPTLLLAGEFDPITPPANGQLVGSTLSHSYFEQFPGTGHGVFLTHVCPSTITRAFLDNPGQHPDDGCLQHMSEPFN